MKYNLRFFSEAENMADQEAPAMEKEVESGGGEKNTAEEEAKFTQEDLNKIISERLKRERGKWDEDLQKKLEQAKTEGEKLARMTEEQKAVHEKEKFETALKEREAELQLREAEITKKELRAQVVDVFTEKKIPIGLAECVNYADAESCSSSMAAIEKAFLQAVEDGVNAKLVMAGTPRVPEKQEDDLFLRGFNAKK